MSAFFYRTDRPTRKEYWHGISFAKPEDMLKDPYVFEFLGIPENKPVLESDLEKALVSHIEKFLLEFGRGFMFSWKDWKNKISNHDRCFSSLLGF